MSIRISFCWSQIAKCSTLSRRRTDYRNSVRLVVNPSIGDARPVGRRTVIVTTPFEFPSEIAARIQSRLNLLYGEQAAAILPRLAEVVSKNGLPRPAGDSRWSEDDTVLITYGDQVRADGGHALAAQHAFLNDNGMQKALSAVHLLPFYPYSSDDGFSVIDYRAVDKATGDWDDVSALNRDYDLMYDLVLNHCSQHSDWFQDCLAGKAPYMDYFITEDPSKPELKQVTRPRSLPLLHDFETSDGVKHFWTTFSRDQVDLNFRSPDVLVEMLDIFLMYVSRGAKIVRLDAIAYLWKELGTTCIHLHETHEVVKLMRDLLDAAAPDVILLTETNVPHKENVSYFGGDETGRADEAHMVYQFSLAPLLLDAFLHEDARPLNDWLSKLEAPQPETTYFNFTASHDGIGVRPLEGLVEPDRFDSLIQKVRDRDGLVSMKANADGSESPYELNITYYSALAPETPDPALHRSRFLASQQVMISLQGISGIYFQSLFGVENWQDGVAETGRARTINRRKYDRSELADWTSATKSERGVIFEAYRDLLSKRRTLAAFHPDNPQVIHNIDPQKLIVIERPAFNGGPAVWTIANVTSAPVTTTIANQSITLPPGSAKWVVTE